jgi:hypothetical protein
MNRVNIIVAILNVCSYGDKIKEDRLNLKAYLSI